MVEAPTALVEAAANVRVVLPLPGAAMLVGAKVAVIPLGTPVIENATAELNPFTSPVVRVRCVEAPWATAMLVALGVSVKLGVKTVRLSV